MYVNLYATFHQEQTWIFLRTLLERVDHQYFNGQHLACEVRAGMCEVLTKSELSFVYKMIREILSMPGADSGYPLNFMISSWVFKDGESESDVKTNSRHRVCLLFVGSPLLAWRVHAQSLLLTHCVNTPMYIHTYIHSSVHSNIHIYVRTTYIQYASNYLHTYLHIYVSTYIHTYILHTYICMYVGSICHDTMMNDEYIHSIYSHTYIHTPIHIHTYAHIK